MAALLKEDLIQLLKSVFPRRAGDEGLGILVDVPRTRETDNPEWKKRRDLARSWMEALSLDPGSLKLKRVGLFAYPDVGSNNADLPAAMTVIRGRLPSLSEEMTKYGESQSTVSLFKDHQILLAPTEYSATAPLKVAARKYGFRAATMPGFSSRMIPALKIDYSLVNQRVMKLKYRLDRARWAEVHFKVDGDRPHTMIFDLRYRKAHASSGRFPEKGTAGNLPSGEAYIVPYEGERRWPSRTEGVLPVQIDDEVVLFTVKENTAIKAAGGGRQARRENRHLKNEPAYGNMAELGFGVLADFGMKPIGEILFDEKLGFHIAFGRSEHFGGMTGPSDFSSPSRVIHLDRIYIPATQPRVAVESLTLGYPDKKTEEIMAVGRYLIF